MGRNRSFAGLHILQAVRAQRGEARRGERVRSEGEPHGKAENATWLVFTQQTAKRGILDQHVRVRKPTSSLPHLPHCTHSSELKLISSRACRATSPHSSPRCDRLPLPFEVSSLRALHRPSSFLAGTDAPVEPAGEKHYQEAHGFRARLPFPIV
jgi:hypothetical protein